MLIKVITGITQVVLVDRWSFKAG